MRDRHATSTIGNVRKGGCTAWLLMCRHQKLAEAMIITLLNGIAWTDEILVKGMSGRRRKQVRHRNAFASQFPRKHRHHKTHLISKAALKHAGGQELIRNLFTNILSRISDTFKYRANELCEDRELLSSSSCHC